MTTDCPEQPAYINLNPSCYLALPHEHVQPDYQAHFDTQAQSDFPAEPGYPDQQPFTPEPSNKDTPPVTTDCPEQPAYINLDPSGYLALPPEHVQPDYPAHFDTQAQPVFPVEPGYPEQQPFTPEPPNEDIPPVTNNCSEQPSYITLDRSGYPAQTAKHVQPDYQAQSDTQTQPYCSAETGYPAQQPYTPEPSNEDPPLVTDNCNEQPAHLHPSGYPAQPSKHAQADTQEQPDCPGVPSCPAVQLPYTPRPSNDDNPPGTEQPNQPIQPVMPVKPDDDHEDSDSDDVSSRICVNFSVVVVVVSFFLFNQIRFLVPVRLVRSTGSGHQKSKACLLKRNKLACMNFRQLAIIAKTVFFCLCGNLLKHFFRVAPKSFL